MIVPSGVAPAFAPATGPGAVPKFGRVDLTIGAALAVIAIFVRLSFLHELLTVLVGAKLYLLYLFGIPALAAVFLTGGLRRVFEGRVAFYWIGFAGWMAVAVPFSSWVGGSFTAFLGYLKTGPVVLVTIAGLIVTWRQCKTMMWGLACAAALSLASGRLFSQDVGGRLGMEFGTIQNANDFAAHLLLGLPFLLWVVLSSRSIVLRLGAFVGIGTGVYMILRTASRGAALALAVDIAFLLWRGTARQRIALLALAPIAAVALAAAVPRNAWERMLAYSQTTADSRFSSIYEDAMGSSAAREYVIRKGLQYSFAHPIVGVGPGEFANYEGGRERSMSGLHGYYRAIHNTYAQVLVECGVPALLFFLAGIFSSLLLLNATHREARRRPDCPDIRTAVFCIMLGIVGFCTAATFLSLAYTFYLPAMGGLAIAVARGAKQEFASRTGQSGDSPGGPPPGQPAIAAARRSG